MGVLGARGEELGVGRIVLVCDSGSTLTRLADLLVCVVVLVLVLIQYSLYILVVVCRHAVILLLLYEGSLTLRSRSD